MKLYRFQVNEEELKKVLEKLKPGKLEGLDCSKSELYNDLTNNRRAMEILVTSYKKVLEDRQEPKEWNK